MTQRKVEYWVIPPTANAEFAAHMEQVLDVYAQPYDPPRVHYVRRPFQREPDFGAASVNYALKDQAGQRGGPAAGRAAGDQARLNSHDATPGGPMPETKVTVPPCPFRRGGHRWLLNRERSTASCQADVCEACGMLRLTSFRTGQPSYEPADEVSLDDAVPRRPRPPDGS